MVEAKFKNFKFNNLILNLVSQIWTKLILILNSVSQIWGKPLQAFFSSIFRPPKPQEESNKPKI